MESEITFLISGIIFGLSSGLTPGPLFALVISETLRHGKSGGIKIAIAPLLTDLPIVLSTIFILSRLKEIDFVLGIISFFGSIFIVYLAYESIAFNASNIKVWELKGQSVRKGVIANFLNPSPYIFWLAIGAPTVVDAFGKSVLSSFLFIFGMYFFMVGAKIMIAILTAKSHFLLRSRNYVYIMRTLGVILIIIAIVFIKNGFQYFGII